MAEQNGSKIYKKLTDEEWNAIQKFIMDNKLDEVLDIMGDEMGDYFWDMEYDCYLPFEAGLDLMEDNIYSDGCVFAYYDYMFRHFIQMIFEKYCENEDRINWVREVNSTIDKGN